MQRAIRLTLCAAMLVFAAQSALLAPPVAADAGMWTLDNLPLQQFQQRYGFRPGA